MVCEFNSGANYTERLSSGHSRRTLTSPAPHAHLLVLTGDIACGLRAVEIFGNPPVLVLYIARNHEVYSLQWQQTRDQLRCAGADMSVVALDNEVADLSVFPLWAASRQEAPTGATR